VIEIFGGFIMDTFMEKIVTKKKGPADYLLTFVLLVAAVFLIMLCFSIQILQQLGLSLLLAAGIIYLVYRIIISRNVEYEYIVTNGDLDIDKITARRKRKRIFSASCKEFEVLAKVSSNSFSQSVQSIKNKINAASNINSPDAYFATLNYKGEKTVVIFEPDERMLNNFKIYIPRKMY
jgi:hypothetical protein